MILTCPNCDTQYVVKDGAIPPEGRQVRCAACKHSWHQDPEVAAPDEEALAPPLRDAGETVSVNSDPQVGSEVDEPIHDENETLAEATLIEPRSGPEAEERAYGEALAEEAAAEASGEPVPETASEPEAADIEAAPPADWNAPPEAEAASDQFSPFAPDDGEPERRSPLSAIMIAALLVIVLAALFWFLAPANLKARLGLAATDATPLQLVTTHMDRQHLESGNDLLTLTGRVINPSAKEQIVPPIQAQLKNKTGQVVYSWTIQPPAPSLAAGASASFNSAEVSVPPGGEELTITLGRAAGRSG